MWIAWAINKNGSVEKKFESFFTIYAVAFLANKFRDWRIISFSNIKVKILLIKAHWCFASKLSIVMVPERWGFVLSASSGLAEGSSEAAAALFGA